MIVKFLTVSGLLLFSAACSRQPEVRSYTEVLQMPVADPNAVAGTTPSAPNQVGPVPEGLMNAGPLSVEPIPENLPPGHPTLATGGPRVPPTGLPGANMQGREGEVPPPPNSSDLTWTLPENWTELPATGMRTAAFAPGGGMEGVVTLIALAGTGGDMEGNIRRWRRQVGLAEEHPHNHVPVKANLSYYLVNLVPESAAKNLENSTLGAIYPLEGRTLFLKFSGPTDTLLNHKGGFLELANSLALKESE